MIRPSEALDNFQRSRSSIGQVIGSKVPKEPPPIPSTNHGAIPTAVARYSKHKKKTIWTSISDKNTCKCQGLSLSKFTELVAAHPRSRPHPPPPKLHPSLNDKGQASFKNHHHTNDHHYTCLKIQTETHSFPLQQRGG